MDALEVNTKLNKDQSKEISHISDRIDTMLREIIGHNPSTSSLPVRKLTKYLQLLGIKLYIHDDANKKGKSLKNAFKSFPSDGVINFGSPNQDISDVNGRSTIFEIPDFGATLEVDSAILELERVPMSALTKRIGEQVNKVFTTVVREVENRELKIIAYIDALTGLPNRRAFEEVYFPELYKRRVMDGIRTEGTEDVLVFVDIDHFKSINDNLGHGVGDSVLQEVARVLSSLTLDCENYGISRLGGEEFVLVLEGVPYGEVESNTRKILQGINSASIPISQESATAILSKKASRARLHRDKQETGELITNEFTGTLHEQQVGELVKVSIGVEPKPLPQVLGGSSKNLPSTSVTTSLGVKIIDYTQDESYEAMKIRVLVEADARLYQAKTGGRNRGITDDAGTTVLPN